MAKDSRIKYGVLADIINSETTEKNESIFYSYRDKKEIGIEIFKELYSKFQADKDQGPTGFYMDDSKQIGILSQCQSLQALMLLASEFGLDFDDKHIIDPEVENLSIREVMDMVIEDVLLKRIHVKTMPGFYRFDASPYENKLFTVEYSNIEAITWVIPSFLLTLKYHADHGETCQWEKQLVEVISYGLRYMNEAFIENEKEGTADRLTIGWNFTKDCEEPSLYYTFAVCECYESFYNIFKKYLDYKRADRDFTRHGIPVDKELSREYQREMKAFEKSLANGDRGTNEQTGKKLAQHDPYNEIRLRYCEINNGIGEIEGTFYGELEDKCKRVAKEIWRITQGEFADAFYYNDLHTKISREEIEMATTSDALFNTVYIVNILLDAGFDKDLRRLWTIAGQGDDMKSVSDAEQEYNNLFESCQMATQMAFRTYEKLQNHGKEYIVDQFLVGFNENFDTHKELIKDLRKRRMRVFSLMPLLIRTNNVISEYLVRYPQINMRKYLGYILENRYVEKRKSKWIWEKDGYFSCSNYYFILALGEFYAYYEQYEGKFIENYANNEAHEKSIAAKTEETLLSPTGTLGLKDLEIQRCKQEIAALKKELASVSKPIEDAVVTVTTENIRQIFPQLLCDFIREAAGGLTVSAINDTPLKDSHTELVTAMGELMVASMSASIYSAIRPSTLSKEEQNTRYHDLEKHIKDDFAEQLCNYVSTVKNSPIHSSQLFDSNKGD